ncbi:4-(cytidine 5'-diphospho)-2-C-methyl-D-erythritol kinase [Swingsia samuiensis]|uniref:4-diphosphocytidyl-2-C-methyl-D-erythritol kinase n=1 Tax=Swingsia samuiensis TaxID=1293412 RepID=A0A4Y6UG73_9PROT|nr:4-(cytidine 5'-diphospho)-2-C-methyl-D-erythritol kinase [Swingsia samuiensis]QDH16559.1 4-(cytidine 5'-diphospho)-2-C-methyl-D-erythritol kinase [Swingsia samuiensis]
MTIASANAHAKINLYLHVTGRRTDGYHLLDSFAVFANAADTLTLEREAAQTSLNITGPFGQKLEADENNLVLKAVKSLQIQHQIDKHFDLTLIKNLPIASGIGGGSADAACILRLLAKQWDIPEPDILAIAAQLGADVPVCVQQEPARMEGIGEILSPTPPPPSGGILLINPGVAVSTPDVFRRLSSMTSLTHHATPQFPVKWSSMIDLKNWLLTTSNDLQEPAIQILPLINDVLQAIAQQENCLLARMSGSGATCFGLFPTAVEAQKAAEALSITATRLNWWTWAGDFFQNSVPPAE